MIEIVVPEINTKNKNVKDIVFSILGDGEPRTISQIHREMKKVYGMSVSFQAVLKAVNSFIENKILAKNDKMYKINPEWIFEARNFMDKLYRIYFNVAEPIKKIELGKEISVYTVTNLLELDRLWSDILFNWARNEENDKRNVWKGKHCWWLIPRLHEEDILHDTLLKKGVKTYNLISENTVLDKIALEYYKNKKENVKIKKLQLKGDFHISAFGEFILKFEVPDEISKKIERIYQKAKKIEDIKLKEILDIFKQNTEIEVIIIKDKYLADKIKEEVINYF